METIQPCASPFESLQIAQPHAISIMAISVSITTKQTVSVCNLVSTGLEASKPRLHKTPKIYEQLPNSQINQICTKIPKISQQREYIPPWKKSANTIEQCKIRFIRAVSLGGNTKCCQIDRSAIIEPHHAQILSEVMKKAQVILRSRKARPNDPVFSTTDSHLKPLDPRFAEPRLDYCADRKRYKGDAFARRAAWRLRKWRAHGWPQAYPAQAVEEERQIDLKRVGSRKLLGLDRDL